MKDSQVDLCGQIGYEGEDSFPVLEKSDTFEFACSGCGDCCRGREDIVLSGYDLYRIAARLRLPPLVVVNAFCRHYTGQNSKMPVVRLQPLKEQRSNCPFLQENHCVIHDAEPLVCALYPLGQQIGLDGSVTYFVQPIDCGGEIIRANTADFLDRYHIQSREALDAQWALTCIALAKRVKALETDYALEAPRLKMVQHHIYHALYLDYDFTMPYEPQWKNNLAALETYLLRVEQLARVRRSGKKM